MSLENFVERGKRGQDAVDDLLKVNASGYKQGLLDGVRRFAWWNSGVQYVGTTGKTLSQAVLEIEQECQDPNYRQPY